MELLKYQSLLEYIHENAPISGKFSFLFIMIVFIILEVETFTIFSQIIDAMAYFHEMGVIHRDLNVFNILIEPKTLNIKIIDFGLSKMIREETATFYSISSLATPTGLITLRAPEVLMQNEYNEKIDIWMAGLVLLSILTNECFPTKKFEKLFIIFSELINKKIR